MFGLCVSPGYIPSAEETKALNPDFYRSILYSLDDLTALKATGKPLLITLNNQCKEVGGEWTGWSYVVQEIGKFLGDQLLLLGCGNEFDLYWNNNPTDVPPEFAAKLAKQASSILGSFRVSAVSVASARWVEYVTQLADLCRDDVGYFDIHPYGQKPNNWGPTGWGFGRLDMTIASMQGITKKPIICSEYGVKIGDVGSEQEVANFMTAAKHTIDSSGVVEHWSWFAWTDAVGAPQERGQAAFGLRAEDGHTRPAWDAYKTLHGGVEVPNLDAWRGKVGEGLLKLMTEDGTSPVMSSEWRPFNRAANEPATIEQCIGRNGVTYFWNLSDNTGWSIPATLRTT